MTAHVYEAGRRLAIGAPATSAHWLEDQALFTLGDGVVLVAGLAGPSKRIEAHNGAILSAALHPSGKQIVTGGDDGQLNAVAPDGKIVALANLRKWVDHIVTNAALNLIVAAAGKQAIVFRDNEEAHRFTHASTIGGLALDPKGRRLAISHYGGVTLRYVLTADDSGVSLPWSGSHLGVAISPGADYVVTAMQENALHGWRLADKLDLRMDGYPAKTRCFSWDRRGRWLATSGAESAIVWPFVGKSGPQGKAPLQLIPRPEKLVTAVAFHPSEEMLAVGYSDGALWLARFADQGVIELDEAGEAPVSALAWDASGARLAVADEAGRGAIIETP